MSLLSSTLMALEDATGMRMETVFKVLRPLGSLGERVAVDLLRYKLRWEIEPSAAVIAFTVACQQYNHTHPMSDDDYSWRRGQEQWATLLKLAQHLPTEVAVRIFNDSVDYYLAPGGRDDWYVSVEQWNEAKSKATGKS